MAAPHLRHPHPEFDEHPWRLLPAALLMIVLLAGLLIAASFVISKLFTGHAY